MRKIAINSVCAIVLIIVAAASALAQNAETEVLSNDQIVSMLKAGLSPTVIVNKIRTSKTKFNLTTNELIRLKEAGLNDEILQAMQGTSETPDPPVYSPPAYTSREMADANDPMSPHDVGIYLYTEKAGVKKLTELEPNVTVQNRTGGKLGNSISYGIIPTKQKARIPGTAANYQVGEAQPVFYFYLNQKDRTMRGVRYLPASINQFQMVKFSVKDKVREVTIGRSNAFGDKSGIIDGDLVEFSYEKVGDGIYKITPKTPLKNGEYGFYLLGTGTGVGATFYDFGVRMVP